jgi:hypothetical protein
MSHCSYSGQYVIRFDSAGTELNLPPGAGLNVQGQSLVLPEGKEGGLTLDQRAMVRYLPRPIETVDSW